MHNAAVIEGLWPDGGNLIDGCDSVCSSVQPAVHEVGHVFSLLHTGAGTDPSNDVDPSYPYPNGTLGVWGYDILDRVLVPPTDQDMMSYGNLRPWISDYSATRRSSPTGRSDSPTYV
jgi:hypothetical protein